MPPKKRARCSTIGAQDDMTPEVACRQSSRSNRSVGGHTAQLQKAGEAIAAPTKSRKGRNNYPELDASDPEENSMAPVRLHQGKKTPAKPWTTNNVPKPKPVPAKPQTTSSNSKRPYQRSGNNHPAHTSPHPVLHTVRSSDRFGFKAPTPTSSVQCTQKANQRDMSEEDDDREDGAEKSGVGQHVDNGEDSSQHSDAPVEDGGDDGRDFDREHDWEDEPMDMEGQDDNTYDVLEHHQAQNGQRKAPSLSYLSKMKGNERASTSIRFKSPCQRLSQSSDHPRSRQCVPSVDASSVQVPTSRRRLSPSHPPKLYIRPKSPRQHSYQPATSMQHTSYASFCKCSPSQTSSDHATTPSHSLSHSTTPIQARCTRNVKTTQENPSKLGFYPPCWQGFLQVAKLQMQLQAVLTHPIPEHKDAVQLAQEVLDAELWVCHQKKLKFEDGYFPAYSLQMCQLLCDDLFTFRTELKKVVISIAKLSYDIFPKGTSLRLEEIKKHVIAAATKLLKTGDYLRIPDSSDGKFKNFVSQALKDVCLKFFYGDSKKVLKNMDDFHQTIPANALILMKGVISGFSETGTNRSPELPADRCRTDFNKLWTSVDKLLNIPELREELEEMLQQWAKIGMSESDWHADGSAAGSDVDINIIL
ncbi:uncharacterized protein F5891DRAFT_1187470 [Suillus fuscotomentosus]|uniref:DUF6532 domain-containing protein n=1 Tax=Suillus fuscotomentosus TaxID=1912939 RepID=A0AAD4E8F9_9AGAM|nr:uncharacterized protein F5891DRAFT_1187470 [Suillus fuscotomentosus]KAG1901599.1 hypothetical protein F5891DRAFT_1187470 [Suillus fuscotomentosus]